MQNINYAFLLSRPVWGAWIEIYNIFVYPRLFSSRAPYGARGLKYEAEDQQSEAVESRAPYGARGLKLVLCAGAGRGRRSRPVWGAWIEIPMGSRTARPIPVAPRMGRVD